VKTTGDLLKESVDHVREIFRSEVRLARAELRAEARTAGQGALLGAFGTLLLVFGVNFLLWALIWALVPDIPIWLASLIVSFTSLAAGGILLFVGYGKFQQVEGPKRTAETMKENLEWMKTRTQ
jgi:uncharacterized membrane protein YqjE